MAWKYCAIKQLRTLQEALITSGVVICAWICYVNGQILMPIIQSNKNVELQKVVCYYDVVF